MPIKFESPLTPVKTICEGYLKVKIFVAFITQTLDIQNLHIPYKLMKIQFLWINRTRKQITFEMILVWSEHRTCTLVLSPSNTLLSL